jgi:cation diffusion facilitator CzcD-associated flavoprotein CzcO
MKDEPPIVGLDGVSLEDVWDPYPQAYLAICVPKLPNFYIYFGPNGGPGSGSAIVFLEQVADWMIKNIQKIQREYIKSMTVRKVATPASPPL